MLGEPSINQGQNDQIIDHLFRHHHGKMVSILTRIFGLAHLEMIEDAVQDTFVSALQKWRTTKPANPEAWLTQAAKNRAIDLLRKIKAENTRIHKLNTGPSAMILNDLFLEHEIEDSQLRMIFTACHPALKAPDQIAFALKTIAGFSIREIASALLIKEDTIKKRLTRARKNIQAHSISFQMPSKTQIPDRMQRVQEVLYLIFNEGFQSNQKDQLIRKDLCGEAIRLCKMLLKKEHLRSGSLYALFALMCFHASRLESKITEQGEIVDLQHQDRSKWYFPLIKVGNDAMIRAMEHDDFSTYHLEAAIAVEHLNARTFDQTNWHKILELYQRLEAIHPSPINSLNQAIVLLQLNQDQKAFGKLTCITAESLEQRAYLYHAAFADYYLKTGRINESLGQIDQALQMVQNTAERNYLVRKRILIENPIH